MAVGYSFQSPPSSRPSAAWAPAWVVWDTLRPSSAPPCSVSLAPSTYCNDPHIYLSIAAPRSYSRRAAPPRGPISWPMPLFKGMNSTQDLSDGRRVPLFSRMRSSKCLEQSYRCLWLPDRDDHYGFRLGASGCSWWYYCSRLSWLGWIGGYADFHCSDGANTIDCYCLATTADTGWNWIASAYATSAWSYFGHRLCLSFGYCEGLTSFEYVSVTLWSYFGSLMYPLLAVARWR